MKRVAVAALAVVLAGIGVADARETIGRETIRERPRPDYDPIGIRVGGGFVLFPSLELGLRHDDNLYRETDANHSAVVTSVRPGLRAVSEWANHEMTFDLGGEFDAHRSGYDDEDSNDWFATGSGRVDLTRNTHAYAGARNRGLHEDRDVPRAAASESPTTFELRDAWLGAFHRWNRLGLEVEGSFAEYSFDDAVSATTGETLRQTDRDRLQRSLRARAAYEIVPSYDAFVEVALRRRRYRELQRGYDRNSDGHALVAGAALDLGGLIVGEVFAGHVRQDYDDARLPAIEAPTVGGEVAWNVTPLTTVGGFVRRTVEETTLETASGFLSTRARIGVDHELLRNLILSVGLDFIRNDYKGITRRDDILGFELGGSYLVNRNVRLDFGWWYEERDSTVESDEYRNNVIGLNVRLQH